MITPDLVTENPEMSPRERFRKLFEDRSKPTDDEDADYYTDQVDSNIYTSSTNVDEVMACYDTFHSPEAGIAGLYRLSEIIKKTKLDAVKLELAKRFDPLLDIKSSVEERASDPQWEGRSFYARQLKGGRLQEEVNHNRKYLSEMVAHSTGEAKEIFESKKAEFEAFVATLGDVE